MLKVNNQPIGQQMGKCYRDILIHWGINFEPYVLTKTSVFSFDHRFIGRISYKESFVHELKWLAINSLCLIMISSFIFPTLNQNIHLENVEMCIHSG